MYTVMLGVLDLISQDIIEEDVLYTGDSRTDAVEAFEAKRLELEALDNADIFKDAFGLMIVLSDNKHYELVII